MTGADRAIHPGEGLTAYDTSASRAAAAPPHAALAEIALHVGRSSREPKADADAQPLRASPRAVRHTPGKGPWTRPGVARARWIWNTNRERRHLTEGQIATATVVLKGLEERVAARKRQASGGGDRKSASAKSLTAPGRRAPASRFPACTYRGRRRAGFWALASQ